MFTINISRQSGSEGNEIACLLCERLGYQYFDKNVMAQIGADMGIAAKKIADVSAEEHAAKGSLQRWFGSYPNPMTNPRGWTFRARSDARQAMTVAQVTELVNAAYDRGNVIVVGRDGQVALAGKPDVLHVRIVAPLELRTTRWQAREGLTAEAARRKVYESDLAHMDFVKRFFGADVNHPALYDLIINTANITPAAADLIIEALTALPAKAK